MLFPYDFPDTGYRDLSLQEVFDNELSGDEDSVADEGEVSSDLIDKQDQTEDMMYRETVSLRSVRFVYGMEPYSNLFFFFFFS